METPPNAPYVPYVPPAATPPKSKTPVILIAVLGSCGCALLMVPILAAILFPVFAQAREKARQASCMSNEKQMALGVLMYTQDYDETYPEGSKWMTQINPYIKNPAIYVCPSVANHTQAETSSMYTYAYSSQMSKRGIESLKTPPLTGLLYDSLALSENASDALTSLPIPGRHLGRNNMGFADGHVKSMDSIQLQELINTPEATLFEKRAKGR